MQGDHEPGSPHIPGLLTGEVLTAHPSLNYRPDIRINRERPDRRQPFKYLSDSMQGCIILTMTEGHMVNSTFLIDIATTYGTRVYIVRVSSEDIW
jgi:hypothetical protein